MKVTILGSSGGLEPVPGRRHTSITVEHKDALYWFDAGESCAYTAAANGIDLLKTQAIFISHPHIDHIGGLTNLFYALRKIDTEKKLKGKSIKLFVPVMSIWQANKMLLSAAKGKLRMDYKIDAVEYREGQIYKHDDFTVSARHTEHLAAIDESLGRWLCNSFVIEAEGKKIIYSADLASLDELEPIGDCDLLLVENGHFTIDEIRNFCSQRIDHIGRVCIYHLGKESIENPEKALENAKKYIPKNKLCLASDGVSIEI